MKILYVNPGKLSSGLDAIVKGAPLNLVTLAAMVPEHDAELFDFKMDKYREDNFRSLLRSSDIVAITSLTPQISHAFVVARMAKEEGCITILGGYHPTLDPVQVISHKRVDYVIRGEGEHTFKELIDYLSSEKNERDLEKINGLSYKDSNGNVIHNAERELEKNLDVFPIPRRDLLGNRKYAALGALTQPVETSRGCPHNCAFCCIIKMWRNSNGGPTYRTKSIKRVMQEIYAVGWKTDFIFFTDDNFSINLKRTNKILDAIIKSGVQHKMHFTCQSRVDVLYQNPDLIDKFDKAGFRQIFLGIESVHQQSLDAMNKKNTTPAMVKHVVNELRSRGISVFGGVIIGFPGETARMVRQNIQYARDMKLDIVQFTPITAFPGTPFYEEMEQKGMITTNDYTHYDLFHTMMGTDELSAQEIYELVAEAYNAFYLQWDWLMGKAMEYLNPFGKFNWMTRRILKLIHQMVLNGRSMLSAQGFGENGLSKELKNKKALMKDVPLYSKQDGKANGKIEISHVMEEPIQIKESSHS
jgi:anaerobic magnesium-protoporphyrin IX monomethyl ester cyclase